MNEMTTFLLVILLILGCGIYTLSELNKQAEIQKQIEIQQIIENVSILDQQKFYLKEMKTENLINGEIKGSFLLIGGSIYGKVSEDKYLFVTYFDNDTIIDNTKDVYKIIKFNIENIEIVTISKNEIPYYKYVGNIYERCTWEDECLEYKITVGKPRLFLPDGWEILNN